MTLPEIHEWWPYLSIEARQEMLEHLDEGRLGERVREEIRDLTGAVVGQREHLTQEDRNYVRTQIEQVD